MPLIVEDTLHEGLMLRKGTSPMYISVNNRYLSRQYGLSLAATHWVEGEVLEVSRILGTLSDEEMKVFEKYVIGKTVRFYLVLGILTPYDNLYFDENSWSILRDVGIFPGEYKLRVKLFKLIIEPEGKIISLYPYRDIIAV
ncbi:MAG: hypothetical protein DRJ59_04460 [Thermoprotei archaeon]|nr:MAG: hypothetical protein DRJ59_04460 [Thermoprotei archaeon]